MQTSPSESTKERGFFKTFLIAVLACLFVLALVVGGAIAYFVYANPQAIQQGAPKVMLDTVSGKKPEMPTSITSEQIACAVGKLGQKRVDEIKGGASITAADMAAAGSCFQ